MATQAAKVLRRRREVAPLPNITPDEIEIALAADGRLKNSYHSMSLNVRMHRSCRDDDVEPLDGTIIHGLWCRGPDGPGLTRRQLVTWQRFWRDLQRSYGDSGPLTVSYKERVSTSSAGVPRPDMDDDEPINARGLANVRMAEWNAEYSRAQEAWSILNDDARAIIEQMIRDHLLVAENLRIHCHTLAYIGTFLCGYRDNRQAISAAVARIQTALNNLARLYRVSDDGR